MTEPKPYAMSRLFSDLTGREISFCLALNPPQSRLRQLYGVYTELPSERAVVVKTDLSLMASLAGALLGLPEETAVERAEANPMDASVRDAIHEVMNIASTALSTDHRVKLLKMTLDPVCCDGKATDVLQKPDVKSNYCVSIGGKVVGGFTILSRL
jgi:hypothetical protein